MRRTPKIIGKPHKGVIGTRTILVLFDLGDIDTDKLSNAEYEQALLFGVAFLIGAGKVKYEALKPDTQS